MKLDPRAQDALTFQQYEPSLRIEGVWYHALTEHRTLEGTFMEYLRLSDGRADGLPAPFEVRQMSVSWAVPGRLNAFHVHPKRIQDELWCVINGAALVWLIDLREDSAMPNRRESYVLSGEAPGLLHIPWGVAHGYKAGPTGAMLLYAANDQFDRQDPNEGRLPWDFFGPELWQENRG